MVLVLFLSQETQQAPLFVVIGFVFLAIVACTVFAAIAAIAVTITIAIAVAVAIAVTIFVSSIAVAAVLMDAVDDDVHL